MGKTLNMQNQVQNEELEDTIYYNVVIPYNPISNGLSLAQYQEQLSQPIVYSPKDYYCTVVRFQVPGQNLPIFYVLIQPFPNVDIKKTIYSVTLSWDANPSPETYIEWMTQAPLIPPPIPPTSQNPDVKVSPYYYVFEYSWFLTLINKALSTAFAALPALPATVPAVGPPVPPYFIFDPITERVSLIAQQVYYDQNTTIPGGPINVYVNYPLTPYIEGIRSIGISNHSPIGQDLLFDIVNENNSNWYIPPGPANPSTVATATLLRMTQEYDALISWNAIKSIQLVSNLLPINREYVPQYNAFRQQILTAQGILADFVPLLIKGPEARTTIDYVSTGPWRLIDLFGESPITRVDLTFYWTDQFGNQNIILVPINEIITCKLLFIKKSIYQERYGK